MSILTFQMPEGVVHEKGDDHRDNFMFEPLERGYGTTIGNALRRILLSSLEGYAIISLKFPSVQHEFSTIKGVKEDVTEIVLNLKKVRFKKISEFVDEKLTISLSDRKEFKAKDIQSATPSFEVLNPNLVICHFETSVEFEIELVIGKGRGYVPAEEHMPKDEKDYGLIFLDAIFTPIRNVEYRVENTRVEQRTDYERLKICVDTDGSIAPKLALQEAAKILIQHFMLFSDDRMEFGSGDGQESVVDERILRMRKMLKTPLEDLDLSVRAYHCLCAADQAGTFKIRTLGDIIQLELKDMMEFRNFGKKSLAELKKLVMDMGMEFGMDLTPYKLEK